MQVCPCTDRKLSLTEGHLPANLGALSASGDQKLMLSYSPLRREQLKHLKCVVFPSNDRNPASATTSIFSERTSGD